MALNLILTADKTDLKPRITVFGVGGAGGNAVNNMIAQQLEGVEFVVANTDAQALQASNAPIKIQMGVKVTEGLGAGARPEIGAASAEETIEEIVDQLAGAHMCFITAGMGGGTGTGAAPIIAQAARHLGVLTVGVVTKPFQFEGNKRMKQAEEGIAALQKVVDTLIIIPNQNLFRIANDRTTFAEAFSMADDVLYQGVKGVTDLMVRPGLINLDFADVRAVMDEMGKAMMGTGEATGEDRARVAAEKAIANPLLDEVSLEGAKGVLINVTGGPDLTLFELDEAANIIRDKVDENANIIVGSTLDPNMSGTMRVSVVATGIDVVQGQKDMPVPRRSLSKPLEPAAPAAPAPAPEMVAEAPLPLVAEQMRPSFERPRYTSAAENKDLFTPAAAHSAAAHPAPREPEDMLNADLPPMPAYTDRTPMQAAQVQAAAQAPEMDAGNFVAPRPRAAGVPSPEALARLQAAVSKTPVSGTRPAMPQSRPMGAPAGAPAQAAAEAPSEKPRFGIGSLINRMAGHAEPSRPAARAMPPVQAPTQTGYDDEQDHMGENSRIEIPAFLRRQAN